jgi:hypothetical protein
VPLGKHPAGKSAPLCRHVRPSHVLLRGNTRTSPSPGSSPSLFLHLWCSTRPIGSVQSSLSLAAIMYKIGNIYFITAIAVIGGGLFGFDISSMSAIIGTQQYKWYR